MTEWELRDLLRAYGGRKQYIKEIEAEISDIKESIISMREFKAVQLTGMPKGSRISSITEEAAEKIIDIYERRINDVLLPRIKNIIALKELAEELIERLTEDERELIEQRYVYRVRWQNIPHHLHMSRSLCFKTHSSAMKKMLGLKSMD